MKMDIYDLMYGLNDVSDYFVMETEKKSSQIKERFIIKCASLAAAVCLVVAGALYSVYMNGGFGNIIPTDKPGSDTGASDADYVSGTDPETEETDYATGTETDTDSENNDPEPKPSTLTGDLTEYSFDYDRLEEMLVPLAKADGYYESGMELSVVIAPETYEYGTIMAFASFDAKYNDINYVVRISLDRDEYEYVETLDWLGDAADKYGLTYLPMTLPFSYYAFSESDKYLLYRDDDTANLKLRDKATGDVITIHEWNDIYDGAARGCGIGNGGVLCADKYVFFTLVTPDYDSYISFCPGIVDYEPDPSVEIVKTNYVYDIVTGEKREFLNGYTLCGVGGNILYLSRESEEAGKTHYYSVDLSDGLNETLRNEEILNEIVMSDDPGESLLCYGVGDVLSDDGRYIVWYDVSDSDKRLNFCSYDRVTKETKTAVAENAIEYSWFRYNVSSEGVYVISCECGDGRVFVFDYTSSF